MKHIVTCESVCKGHPDKLCDLIADSILDETLKKDPQARVACEVMAAHDRILVAGEITANQFVPYKTIAKDVLDDVGYNAEKFRYEFSVAKQSPDISGGVSTSLEVREGEDVDELGAGDQGTMYGYATNESYEYLPLPLVFAHKICKRLDECMKNRTIKDIGPDGKAQVSVAYEDGKPKEVTAIVISVQHAASKDLDQLKREIVKEILYPVFDKFPIAYGAEILVNPSGRFVKGGPEADTGLTGRKIIVDTYGGVASHGGGAFSGKDATKVDRSAAYMARAIAKNIVKAQLADRCQVSLSYAIGKAKPVAISVNTYGTGTVDEETLVTAIQKVFELTPRAIINTLHLREPIFARTATYGHFSDPTYPWETLDRTKELMEAVKDVD